jgi:hypothetical protein
METFLNRLGERGYNKIEVKNILEKVTLGDRKNTLKSGHFLTFITGQLCMITTDNGNGPSSTLIHN